MSPWSEFPPLQILSLLVRQHPVIASFVPPLCGLNTYSCGGYCFYTKAVNRLIFVLRFLATQLNLKRTPVLWWVRVRTE